LTGDGGDESFAGYSHHQGRYLGDVVRRAVPGRVVEWLLRAGTDAMDSGADSFHASATRFLRYVHGDPVVNWSSADLWSLHHLKAVWSARYRDLPSQATLLGYAIESDAEFAGESTIDRALFHDLNVLLPFCYNVKLDVATMMSSLEARSPFMDRDVVEWAARLPAQVKMRPWERKALLKRIAAKRLPRSVVYRPKHGFSVPVDAWFRGSWAAAAHDIVFSDQARERGLFDYGYLQQLWNAHASGAANHGFRFWALLWLEMWHRMFMDATMPASMEHHSQAVSLA